VRSQWLTAWAMVRPCWDFEKRSNIIGKTNFLLLYQETHLFSMKLCRLCCRVVRTMTRCCC
jgi:hypothetical protein